MNIPPSPDFPGYDPAQARLVMARAITVCGAGLVTSALRGLPGVEPTGGKGGIFRSAPEGVQMGTWRYHPDKRGKLVVSHVVADIVLAEETLPTPAAAGHVAAVLGQHLADVGDIALPEVLAMLEGLSVAAG